MVRKMLVLAAALVLLAAPGSASAQGYGQANFLTVSDPTPVPGQTITVTGCCFSDTVAIDLSPGSRRLATATAGANGVFQVEVTIPTDLTPGPYTLFATGTALDGSGPLRLSVDITVVPAGAVDDGADGRAAGALPRTGADSLPLVQIGLALLLVGVGAVLSVRNRRSRTRRDDKVSVTS